MDMWATFFMLGARTQMSGLMNAVVHQSLPVHVTPVTFSIVTIESAWQLLVGWRLFGARAPAIIVMTWVGHCMSALRPLQCGAREFMHQGILEVVRTWYASSRCWWGVEGSIISCTAPINLGNSASVSCSIVTNLRWPVTLKLKA